MPATEILGLDAILHGRTYSGQNGRVRRFASGRVCGRHDCDTVLSSYNPSGRCWAHTEARPTVTPVHARSVTDGPTILLAHEERAMIRTLERVRPSRTRRHPEPAPEPAPAPPAPPTPPGRLVAP